MQPYPTDVLLGDIIKSLNSTDVEDRDKAIAEADKLISQTKTAKMPAPDRTGVNRTVINKSTSPNPPNSAGPTSEPHSDQGG